MKIFLCGKTLTFSKTCVLFWNLHFYFCILLFLLYSSLVISYLLSVQNSLFVFSDFPCACLRKNLQFLRQDYLSLSFLISSNSSSDVFQIHFHFLKNYLVLSANSCFSRFLSVFFYFYFFYVCAHFYFQMKYLMSFVKMNGQICVSFLISRLFYGRFPFSVLTFSVHLLHCHCPMRQMNRASYTSYLKNVFLIVF